MIILQLKNNEIEISEQEAEEIYLYLKNIFDMINSNFRGQYETK